MNTRAIVATSACGAIDLLVVAWVLLRGRAPIGTARVLAAAAAATCCVGAQLACVLWRQHFFLAISIVWVFLAVALPACALLVLRAARHRPVGALARVLSWTALATVPLSLWASFVEPYRLVTERTTVSIDPARSLARPLTIGVLADLQLVEITDREREAVQRVMDARPDLVLIPGDLAQVGSDNVPALAPSYRELLAPLDAPFGVWCVHGDCETLNDARALVAGTRVRVLDDEVVTLEHEGVKLALAGISLRVYTPRARAALAALQARPPDELCLVVAHRPDVVYELHDGSRVDLVVAGHTHGGQVVVPLLGPPFVLSSVPRAVGAGGLHELDGNRLYVSRGIGWEHGHAPRLRLFCPPEVTLLTLEPERAP